MHEYSTQKTHLYLVYLVLVNDLMLAGWIAKVPLCEADRGPVDGILGIAWTVTAWRHVSIAYKHKADHTLEAHPEKVSGDCW